MKASYSHAAPYIREAIINAASLKLHAKTQRKQREYVGQMFGMLRALEILLRSPEGKDSPAGYPDWHGSPNAVPEVERFVGGPADMKRLGFVEEA